MKRNALIALCLFSIFSLTLYANQVDTKSSDGINWFNVLILIGYLGGVFILLPIVIYTNLKEKLYDSGDDSPPQIIENLDQADRNNRSIEVLEAIEKKLTPFEGEDGSEWITITNGSQARFVRRGLNYINKYLQPDNAEIKNRVSEFTEVYNDRTRRVFTGSNWIIACAIGLGILFIITGGISTFIFIHALGILFYILSSRTTFYGIEKKMKYFGRGGGLISSIMSALFLGNGVKYYIKEGSGPWKRDWETEGEMALIGFILLFIIAMLLGFFAAFMGVVNFIFNYSTSLILPFKTDEQWYEEQFLQSVSV